MRRLDRGLSQSELAANSGVSRTTVQKVEAGEAVKLSTLRKLANSLRVMEGDILAPIDEWDRPYHVHTGDPSKWIVAFNLPGSPGLYPDGTSVPDDSEKSRLGRNGFVNAFQSPLACELPHGRLRAGLMEIYGNDQKGPFRHPEEEFVYCLRGTVRVTVGSNEIDLSAGQAMTFWSTEAHSYGLPRPLRKDDEPPLILMVTLFGKNLESSRVKPQKRKSRARPKP